MPALRTLAPLVALFTACQVSTTQDGNGNGSTTVGPSDPPTGTGTSSLVCSAGDQYKNVALQRSFQSIAMCHRDGSHTLRVQVGSDGCDTLSFVVPSYAGPGTYEGSVEVYTVDPNTGCMQGIGVATTAPEDVPDACGTKTPPPCSIVVQGTATLSSKGNLSLQATCASFAFSRSDPLACGTCTQSGDIRAAITGCDMSADGG